MQEINGAGSNSLATSAKRSDTNSGQLVKPLFLDLPPLDGMQRHWTSMNSARTAAHSSAAFLSHSNIDSLSVANDSDADSSCGRERDLLPRSYLRELRVDRERRAAKERSHAVAQKESMLYDREVHINVRVATKKADRSMGRMTEDLERTKEVLEIFPSWKQ